MLCVPKNVWSQKCLNCLANCTKNKNPKKSYFSVGQEEMLKSENNFLKMTKSVHMSSSSSSSSPFLPPAFRFITILKFWYFSIFFLFPLKLHFFNFCLYFLNFLLLIQQFFFRFPMKLKVPFSTCFEILCFNFLKSFWLCWWLNLTGSSSWALVYLAIWVSSNRSLFLRHSASISNFTQWPI